MQYVPVVIQNRAPGLAEKRRGARLSIYGRACILLLLSSHELNFDPNVTPLPATEVKALRVDIQRVPAERIILKGAGQRNKHSSLVCGVWSVDFHGRKLFHLSRRATRAVVRKWFYLPKVRGQTTGHILQRGRDVYF